MHVKASWPLYVLVLCPTMQIIESENVFPCYSEIMEISRNSRCTSLLNLRFIVHGLVGRNRYWVGWNICGKHNQIWPKVEHCIIVWYSYSHTFMTKHVNSTSTPTSYLSHLRDCDISCIEASLGKDFSFVVRCNTCSVFVTVMVLWTKCCYQDSNLWPFNKSS